MKYLGMEATLVKDSDDFLRKVELSQDLYIDQRLPNLIDYDMKISTKCGRVPMSSTVDLRIAEGNTRNDSLSPITGVLRYLADRTRPDILVATGESAGGAFTF